MPDAQTLPPQVWIDLANADANRPEDDCWAGLARDALTTTETPDYTAPQ
ncbi:hypothetical protein IQ254_11715 [Nodosilinea sp. LEGE 07088]|nr:hypothetical protein [Nodosilinea sp. LEGE 07088]MBE9137852.1 hypothetical protein [Nodosilinea sp. LEGE 07088]